MERRDIGREAVEKIFQTLKVDEEWAVRRPRGFTWWAYGLAQHIDAGEPWQDDEYQLSKIRIVTALVKSLDSKRQPEQIAAGRNLLAGLKPIRSDRFSHRSIFAPPV